MKATFASHLMGAFCAVAQSQCHRIAPSLHRKNHSMICYPAFNIHCRTGSKKLNYVLMQFKKAAGHGGLFVKNA